MSVDAAPATGEDWPSEDFAEWVKTSSSTARDFCRAMVTTSSGAIPVYFAVLKYLGQAQVPGRGWGLVSAAPPILFLAAATVFVLALRPVLLVIDTENFVHVRARRLREMHQRIVLGVSLFGFALLVSVALFVTLMVG